MYHAREYMTLVLFLNSLRWLVQLVKMTPIRLLHIKGILFFFSDKEQFWGEIIWAYVIVLLFLKLLPNFIIHLFPQKKFTDFFFHSVSYNSVLSLFILLLNISIVCLWELQIHNNKWLNKLCSHMIESYLWKSNLNILI